MCSKIDNDVECAKYFKSQRAYGRCFEEFRKKWKSYGRVTGIINLKAASEEERRAIGGITGETFYDEDIRFSFAKFEQGLQRTRYAPVDMKEVLEAYFGETLLTNQGLQEEEKKQKEAFFDKVGEAFRTDYGAESVVYRWLLDMISAKKYGYHILVREYEKEPVKAEKLMQNTGNAATETMKLKSQDETCPLAVLAARISGNPHYFDRGTTAGQLMMHAICYSEKQELPENAHQWREILQQVGVVPDNVASMVHAYGLRLCRQEGWHPAYDAFAGRGEPCVITMENLSGIIGVQAKGNCVYIVENEMVFTYILNHARGRDYTVLCTSGQLRAAAQKLIPLILESGAAVYYSGDTDPDGLGIADRLWQKFGDAIHIWRMSPEDYEKSLSEEYIDERGIIKLENLKNPLLKRTAECMREKRMAGYQENIPGELVGDVGKEILI